MNESASRRRDERRGGRAHLDDFEMDRLVVQQFRSSTRRGRTNHSGRKKGKKREITESVSLPRRPRESERRVERSSKRAKLNSPLSLTHVDPQQRHQERSPRLLRNSHSPPHRSSTQSSPRVQSKIMSDRLSNSSGNDLSSLRTKGFG